jgi:hypothetical protein
MDMVRCVEVSIDGKKEFYAGAAEITQKFTNLPIMGDLLPRVITAIERSQRRKLSLPEIGYEAEIEFIDSQPYQGGEIEIRRDGTEELHVFRSSI